MASIGRQTRPHFRMSEKFKSHDLTSELYLVSTNVLLSVCSKDGYNLRMHESFWVTVIYNQSPQEVSLAGVVVSYHKKSVIARMKIIFVLPSVNQILRRPFLDE